MPSKLFSPLLHHPHARQYAVGTAAPRLRFSPLTSSVYSRAARRPFWRLLCRAGCFQRGSASVLGRIWTRNGVFFGVGAQKTRFCVAQASSVCLWVWETLLPVMRLATQYENGQPERLSIVSLFGAEGDRVGLGDPSPGNEISYPVRKRTAGKAVHCFLVLGRRIELLLRD